MQKLIRKLPLLLAAMVVLLCSGNSVSLASHACCIGLETGSHDSSSSKHAPDEMAACCQGQAALVQSAQVQPAGDDPGSVWLTAPMWAEPDWAAVTASIILSRQAKAWVKDDSRRHLELSVLLN